MLDAPLIVFNYFDNALLAVGWVIQNAVWDVMTQTGLAIVPFIALIVSEWYRARQEGDEAGDKGVLSINRIEARLYAMALVVLFTCQPLFNVQLTTADMDEARASQCGTTQASTGQWGESTTTLLDGKIPQIPVWWAFVHAVSHGITNAAVGAIPCSTDYHSIRTELDLTNIEDTGLQREIGEFQLACFGQARSKLLQETGNADALSDNDADWLGSRHFLEEEGYYDSLYAHRPIEGFPYDPDRDASRPNTGPGQDGQPTCAEWWSAPDVGLRARIEGEIDPNLWDRVRGVFTSNEADDYVIRRMVSPRAGAGAGNLNQAVAGYGDIQGGYRTSLNMLTDWLTRGSAVTGGLAGALPFQAGIDMLNQALPMVKAILVMAIVICLPFVMLISGYSFKVAGVATFGFFATVFLAFWWELARWMRSNLVDLIYNSDAARMSWLAAIENRYDRLVLMFVEGAMFFVLPALWLGALAWAGMKVGTAISVKGGAGEAQGAGKQGGSTAQGAAKKAATKK
ncbi:conjugal transfer protein TraG N-terminal domain-containing protein [Vreelandella zhaodongensis]|uniref:conjugal transfer protein TraG N-terminal domain-containing protein n=1 Tax=Vreelandella zhaodongensis TaxID=1176240 RepID=UPI003EB7304E